MPSHIYFVPSHNSFELLFVADIGSTFSDREFKIGTHSRQFSVPFLFRNSGLGKYLSLHFYTVELSEKLYQPNVKLSGIKCKHWLFSNFGDSSQELLRTSSLSPNELQLGHQSTMLFATEQIF